jgi:hypothetical protein
MTRNRGPYYHRVPVLPDPLLGRFLDAARGAEADAALEEVLTGILPVLHEVVRRELGGSAAGMAHVDDVVADARFRLVRKLLWMRDERAAGQPEVIEHLAAYAAVTAERTAYAFLRRAFPERTRLTNRLRYALARLPGCVFEPGPTGAWQCAARPGPRRAPAPGALERFIGDPAGWLRDERIDPALPLPALIEAVLSRLDRPVPFDRFVTSLAAALGIVDAPMVAAPAPELEPRDPAPAISDVLSLRSHLTRVWSEIAELPLRQRVALLLNLRDPDGGAVLQLLPATGVVAMEGIADALGLSQEALSSVWEDLPLDDLSIAHHLGLTRQQVINLRKSARARLSRRMAAW